MIFVDTGAFLARYLVRDQYHEISIKTWESLEKRNPLFYTSNFILSEVFTLLGRWAGHSFAAERAQRIYETERINILRPVEEDEKNALQTFTKFADLRISFTDCVSSALMKREKLIDVFTFDKHFEFLGFQPVTRIN